MTTVMKNIKARAIPKPANDQNTDDIIPARYLKEITFKNMGEYAYFDERYVDSKAVLDHPLNSEKYKSASILIGGANYGCGSSREHAPQALKRFGIDAIVAESFAEIFAGNCASLGLVGVTVSKDEIAKIVGFIEKNPGEEIEIDLEKKIIRYDELEIECDIPEGRRQSFLNGTWDAMAVLLENQKGIQEIASKLPYLHFK